MINRVAYPTENKWHIAILEDTNHSSLRSLCDYVSYTFGRDSIAVDIAPILHILMDEELCTEGPSLRQLDFNDVKCFEELSAKMSPLEGSSNKIQKRILREGIGPLLGHASYKRVIFHYNAYRDESSRPFDSSFVIRKHLELYATTISKIPGLKAILDSMRIQEQAQFLVDPVYTISFNKFMSKCPDERILFEVSLENCLGDIHSSISESEENSFGELLNPAWSVEIVDDWIKQIIESNRGNESLFSFSDDITVSYKDRVLRRTRLYLSACWALLNEPFQVYREFKKLYFMYLAKEMKIPHAAHYWFAVALTQLTHFDCAEVHLHAASSYDKAKDLIHLTDVKHWYFDMQTWFAKNLYVNHEIYLEEEQQTGILDSFQAFIQKFYKKFQFNRNVLLIELPDNLTEKEMGVVCEQAITFNLKLYRLRRGNRKMCVICKPCMKYA